MIISRIGQLERQAEINYDQKTDVPLLTEMNTVAE